MDGYFDVMSEDDGSPDNEALLDGIVAELHDAALDAFTAVDTICPVLPWKQNWVPEDKENSPATWKEEIRNRFLIFSQADVKIGSDEGIQKIIDDLEKVRGTFSEGSKTDLQQAHDMLSEWSGSAAIAAKAHLLKLADDYERVVTALSVLQSDVVASREAVLKGRNDLKNMAGTFLSAAEQYEQAEEANERGNSEVLTDAFVGAIAGLLAVPTGGTSILAAGAAMAAASAAGSVVVGEITHKPLAGDKPKDIYEEFLETVDDLEQGVVQAMERLTHDIEKMTLPTLDDPPDVSPGKSFDPDKFGTDDAPKDTEQNVRDSGKDIPKYRQGDRKKERERAEDHVAEPIRN